MKVALVYTGDSTPLESLIFILHKMNHTVQIVLPPYVNNKVDADVIMIWSKYGPNLSDCQQRTPKRLVYPNLPDRGSNWVKAFMDINYLQHLEEGKPMIFLGGAMFYLIEYAKLGMITITDVVQEGASVLQGDHELLTTYISEKMYIPVEVIGHVTYKTSKGMVVGFSNGENLIAMNTFPNEVVIHKIFQNISPEERDDNENGSVIKNDPPPAPPIQNVKHGLARKKARLDIEKDIQGQSDLEVS